MVILKVTITTKTGLSKDRGRQRTNSKGVTITTKTGLSKEEKTLTTSITQFIKTMDI